MLCGRANSQSAGDWNYLVASSVANRFIFSSVTESREPGAAGT